jgi:hypothetical protein
MAGTITGVRTWSVKRDDCSYREYKVTFRVRMAGDTEGPATALQTPGLPTYGSIWSFNVKPSGPGDVDVFAWCRWDCDVKSVLENEPFNQFDLTFTFSTKPVDPDKCACMTEQTSDPLLVPPKISGKYNKYQEEGIKDRFGKDIVNSAFENIRGPQNEWDHNRAQITIVQNVASAYQGYMLPQQMIDTVNAFPLWGLPPRCIKLSEAPWDRKYFGICSYYYERTLTFDIRTKLAGSILGTGTHSLHLVSGFDRDIRDEATKVLKGHWDAGTGHWVLEQIAGASPDPTNPTHFIRWKDVHGENMRGILNGHGVPARTVVQGTGTGTDQTMEGSIHVEYYYESDFSLLGIPLFF